MIGSEKMNKGPDRLYACDDGVNRTMSEVGELTEQGIAVSIIKKKRGKYKLMKEDGWIGGFRQPPKIMFPRQLRGGGWIE